MLKTLIAVDGSDHALHAIEAVAALARMGLPVQVTLLNVREDPVYYGELPPQSIEAIAEGQQQRQAAVLQAAAKHARELGIEPVALRRAQGWISDEILREAAELGAEQIVMGTRGMGAMRSLIMGSVAQRVVHEAKVPVLLVK
jgi:nucleotide-binding universal stress UspA family protein